MGENIYITFLKWMYERMKDMNNTIDLNLISHEFLNKLFTG